MIDNTGRTETVTRKKLNCPYTKSLSSYPAVSPYRPAPAENFNQIWSGIKNEAPDADSPFFDAFIP